MRLEVRLLTFMFSVFVVAASALGQSCITYQPDFSVYTDETTDGTNIYTSVLIDGSGTMTYNASLPGCAGIDIGIAAHTPSVTNFISQDGGGPTFGGTTFGTSECPDCYVSFSNDQQFVANPGVEYNFEDGGEVICNVGGTVFGTGGFVGVSIAVTTYKLLTVNANGTATFTQACPGNTRPSCGAANYLGQEPALWAEEFQLKVTVGGSGPSCLPVSIVQYQNGPPAPYPCT